MDVSLCAIPVIDRYTTTIIVASFYRRRVWVVRVGLYFSRPSKVDAYELVHSDSVWPVSAWEP